MRRIRGHTCFAIVLPPGCLVRALPWPKSANCYVIGALRPRHRDGQRLLDFVSFLEERGATSITTALALEWAQQPSSAQPGTWAQRLSYVRGFARYRSTTDPQTEIPSSK